MLVLSRRENEKVLFPAIGVSVGIIKTQGRTVRLGIEAPREIRVIRAELADDGDLAQFNSLPASAPDSSCPTIEPDARLAIQKQIDAASLAIHLAKNQLRQGLEVRAADAIDQALDCLQSLEDSLTMDSLDAPHDIQVRESNPRYQTQRQTCTMVLNSDVHPIHPVSGPWQPA